MTTSLEQLSEVIALIHEAGVSPERWPDALSGVMTLLEGSRIALMDMDASSDRLLGMTQIGHDPANAKVYAEHYFAVDPTRAACLTVAVLQASTVYEHFPKGVRDRHEYFDFARSCDIGDVIGVSTTAVLGVRSTLSLQRPLDAQAYGAEHKSLINLLAPHIQIAKRVEGKLGRLKSEKLELEAVLSRLSIPAFVVDKQATVRHLNVAANFFLSSQRHIASRGGKLVFENARVKDKFECSLRNAARDSGKSSAFPIFLGASTVMEVLVAPLNACHEAASIWQVPLAIVVIASPETDAKSIAWRMQQIYRLTPMEGRIAAALAAGKTVEEVAAENGVALGTLRAQLRSIFSKTGTSRQAELVRIALAGSGIKVDE